MIIIIIITFLRIVNKDTIHHDCITAVIQSPEAARVERGARNFIYHGGRPPRLAHDLSVAYTRPISAACMPAPWGVGMMSVGYAAKHGMTLHRYLSAVYLMGVNVVIDRPQ